MAHHDAPPRGRPDQYEMPRARSTSGETSPAASKAAAFAVETSTGETYSPPFSLSARACKIASGEAVTVSTAPARRALRPVLCAFTRAPPQTEHQRTLPPK